jgi:hypothetical protein
LFQRTNSKGARDEIARLLGRAEAASRGGGINRRSALSAERRAGDNNITHRDQGRSRPRIRRQSKKRLAAKIDISQVPGQDRVCVFALENTACHERGWSIFSTSFG